MTTPTKESFACAASAPPRGTTISLEIGMPALSAMADAMRPARSHVHITGWHITPEFALVRGERPTVLYELLKELASRVRVRVLIWAGAPVPVLRPWRGDVRKVRDQLKAGS